MTAEPITVDLAWTAGQLRRLRAFRHHTAYPVVAVDGAPLGIVRADDLDGVEDATSAADLMRPVETVRADADLDATVRRLATSDAGRFAVVDPDGRLVGVLTKADVVRWLQRADGAPPGDGGGATKPRPDPMAD